MRETLLKMYNAILCYSNSKWAIYILSLISFIESWFFILPPDILLVPMALANPRKAFFYAAITSFFSVLGGILGYVIGYYFYEYIGIVIINYLNYQNKIKLLAEYYDKYNFLAIFLAGFTPFPYKLITLFSGFVKANFFIFILASILSRFGRFFLLAGIIYCFKDNAKLIIKNHIGKISILFGIIIVLIGYIFFIKG